MGRNSSRDSRPRDCPECVKLNEHRPKELYTLRCKDHGCPVLRSSGLPCGRKKGRDEYGCMDHPAPPPPPPPRTCKVEQCPRVLSNTSPYCDLHKCTVSSCQGPADVQNGEDFCGDHKCSAPRCQSFRKRNIVGDDLVPALFCRPHECATTGCQAQKVSRKNHCEAHCCTAPECQSSRRPDLDTYCLSHYREKVSIAAAAKKEAEIRAQFQAQAEADAIRQAEAIKQAEATKQAQEYLESIRLAKELEKEERMKKAEETILRSHRAKAEEDEERRLRDEKRQREKWEAAEREKEKRKRDERMRYQTQRQWEKSPRSSGSHFYEKPTNRHGHDAPSSPRSDGPAFEIPHRTRPKGTNHKDEDDSSSQSLFSNKYSFDDVPGRPKAESTLPTTLPGQADLFKEDNEDTQTIFTDNQSLHLPKPTRAHLINAFAGEIVDLVTGLPGVHDDSMNRISAALPELLKEFAQELSQSAQPGIQKDATTFVRHCRKYIANSFHEAVQVNENDVEPEVPMTMEEKMNKWEWDHMDPGSVQVERPEDAIQDADLDNDSDTEDDSPVPDYAEARKFLFEHEAYQNLQARIQAASLLTSREGETIEVIRDTIMKTLVGKHPRLDQTKPNKGLPSLELVLLWNPIDFLIAQYGYVDSTEFKDIITLTGSAIDAQAATCGQYVAQVWPRTGHEILNTLDASIRHMSRFHSCQLPDGTKLNVQVCDDFVKVATTGPAPGVADVVEQLIWLGAACQTSPSPRRLAFSNAHVTSMATRVPTFSINYDLEHLEPDSSEENGSCWHALFKNPVIVKGFPIFARRYGEKGLEIPLNMMAGIGEAERATIFGDQLLIKGFSTMFVPTLQTQDSIIWHFVFDGNNKRIPYTAAKERCPDRISSDVISYTSITGRRHFLGWASSVNLNTGARNMKYTDLAFTGSNFARAGCALEKVSISGGKFVTMGASFARGNKDSTLVRSAQGPYEYKIYAASQMKVIFYDTTERCAWLVDGANALLHMTRAQLSRAPCCDSELLDLEKFPYANPESDHRAGYQSLQAIGKSKNLYIFMNDPNFGQSTSAENRWGVKDVVLENWNILEQIQDHQQDLAGPGMQIRLTDRDKLEGFGFLDIISGIPTIRPRVATLESSGRGWVDFTRELNAITLMARGFGELMSPAKDCNNLCQGWARVPKGKDYLVARTDHLKSICEEMGNLESQPLELVQDIYWHSGGALFDACSCGNNSLSCDRVQVLLPKLTIGFKRKPAGLFEGDLRGAVVFGRSDRFSKWWPRNPKVGPKDTEAACIGEDELQIAANATQESIFQDSGLGTDEAQSFGEASASKTKGQQDPPSNKSPPLAPPSSSSNQGKQLQTAPRTVSASRLF